MKSSHVTFVGKYISYTASKFLMPEGCEKVDKSRFGLFADV